MDAFTALADPTRRQIIEVLASGERSAGELANRFEISQPAVSQHLRSLREVGIVHVRPDAQRRIYSLRREGLAEVDTWLGEVGRFWSERLERLEQVLLEEDKESKQE